MPGTARGRRRSVLGSSVAIIVLLFGVVSLLGDASYEGLRSLLPVEEPSTLGLSGIVGVGELVAWGLRPVSGLVVEIVGGYWAAVILGYALIPVGVAAALSSGGGLGLAAGYWVERLGKAVRGPARDSLLSAAAPGSKRGLVFGVHEALDQLGAIIGLVIAYTIVSHNAPWVLLAVPGALTVPVLLVAKRLYPAEALERMGKGVRVAARSVRASLPAALMVLGLGSLTPNPLAVSHVASLAGVEAGILPLLYAAAMASDALSAIPLGALYDRSPALSVGVLAGSGLGAAAALLAGHPALAALLSGVAEAGYETVARAMARGATGYGLLGLSRGVSAAASILVYSLAYRALA